MNSSRTAQSPSWLATIPKFWNINLASGNLQIHETEHLTRRFQMASQLLTAFMSSDLD